MRVGISTRSEIFQAGLESVVASAHHASARLSTDLDMLVTEIDQTINVLVTTEYQVAMRFAGHVPVIFITPGDTESRLSTLIKSGVCAILPHDSPSKVLTGTLELISEGIQIVPKMDGVLRAMNSMIIQSIGASIAPRELDTVSLVTAGKSNAEIADILGLSLGTVKNYVTSAMRKLGLANRTELALWGIRAGLTPSIPEASPQALSRISPKISTTSTKKKGARHGS